MKKILITLSIVIAGFCFAAAQNNNQNNQNKNQNRQDPNQGNQQNKPPQMLQPNMQKDTVPLFSGHCAGPVKISEISKVDSLSLNKVGFLITGFSLVYRKDTNLMKFVSKNAKLTVEMKSALKTLTQGQHFSFTNVRILAKDGIIRKPTYDQIDLFVDKD